MDRFFRRRHKEDLSDGLFSDFSDDFFHLQSDIDRIFQEFSHEFAHFDIPITGNHDYLTPRPPESPRDYMLKYPEELHSTLNRLPDHDTVLDGKINEHNLDQMLSQAVPSPNSDQSKPAYRRRSFFPWSLFGDFSSLSPDNSSDTDLSGKGFPGSQFDMPSHANGPLGHSYSKSIRISRKVGPDGIVEEKKVVSDGQGNEEVTIKRYRSDGTELPANISPSLSNLYNPMPVLNFDPSA